MQQPETVEVGPLWKYRTEIRSGRKYLIIEVEGKDFKHVLILDERRVELVNEVWARRPDPQEDREGTER